MDIETLKIIGIPSLLGVILGWILNACAGRRRGFEFYGPTAEEAGIWKIEDGAGGRGKKISVLFNIHNPNQHPLTIRNLFCRKKGDKRTFGRETSMDVSTGNPISSTQIIKGWDIQKVRMSFVTESVQIKDVTWDEIEFGYYDIKGKEKIIGRSIYPESMKRLGASGGI